jgi:hypothetical protein
VNGGAPATPLRAVRVTPVLVDDLAPTRAVGHPAPPEPEALRWTRAWMVAWQAALHARGVIGATDAATVALPRADWPTLRGDPDRRRQAQAVHALVASGLAHLDANGALRLGDRAFVAHRAGLELDWPAALRACRAEPASLLTLRAVVDGLAALDDPGPITLRELAGRTGYGEKQVRIALHRLVEAGVLATREAPGQPTRYRVTDPLLGRRTARPSPPAAQLVTRPGPDSAPPPAAPPAAAHPATTARPAPAFRLTLNGATVALAAGLTAHVELDADGVPHLHVTAPPRD